MSKYFYNETQDFYWEVMIPVENFDDYIAKMDTTDNIITVPKRPCHCHDWINNSWVENVSKKQEFEAMFVRSQRDYKLKTEVDLTVSNPLRWAEMTSEKQTEWAAYRTALLNLPEQEGFPLNVTWPTKPEQE